MELVSVWVQGFVPEYVWLDGQVPVEKVIAINPWVLAGVLVYNEFLWGLLKRQPEGWLQEMLEMPECQNMAVEPLL